MPLVKKILVLFTLFVFAGASAYCKPIQKEVQIQTKDARIIKANVSYIKIEGRKKYPTVVLLHSLGYSSDGWGTLISDLQNQGYAVVAVDLRGHGKSIYDASLHQKTWPYFTNKTYKRFPSDVLAVLNEAQKEVKIISLDNMAMVGADIGANTAVLVAKDLKNKPKTLVLISPTTSFKGLYIPIILTQLGQVPILSIVSKQDKYCLGQQRELAKFAQGGFYAKNYPNGGMGMLMLKVNPTMAQDITGWIVRYLK